MDLQNAISAYQNGGMQASLSADVSHLGQFATTVASAPTGPQQVIQNPNANLGNLAKFGHFIGGVAGEVGHLAAGATDWLAHQAVNMVEAPIKVGEGLGHAVLDNISFNTINAQSKQNSDLLANVTQAYKSGRMTAQQYTEALKGINQDNSSLVSQTTSTRNQTSIDQKATVQATWDTAATLVAVLTAGLGSAAATSITADGLTPLAVKSAGDFLASSAAKPFLSSTEEFISRVASQPEVFNALSDTAKMALQRSTAEVVASGTTMSAAQIARASAVNLALKYPLYYGTIAPTGSQIYHELDSGKYGDAVRTLAFNAALLLSGGPIGHALKYGGDALKGISARMFGQTSFWDELSKFYGDGSPQGFRDAVVKATADMSQPEKDQFVRNLSAVEHTNVAATGGDAVAAANRVATGMTANEGVSLSSVSHEEALNNMVNFAEAQRLADTAAKEAGLGQVAVGRVDARALNEISAKLVNAPDNASRLQAWETLKQENPTQAWANNSNFDTQIKNLIAKHEDVTSLDSAIRGIKAQFSVKGFPEKVGAKLAKMGYIPIKPVVNEAPFAEGSGKLISKFAGEGDIWTKSVQPVPILGDIGSMLTGMGLSPNASTQQVYQMYNAALAKNLAETTLIKGSKMVGETAEQTTDTMIKRLSEYMHSPTRGGITIGETRLRAPMTDLRQLSTKDIMTALDVSASDAKDVGNAIMQSMLDVPLAVRGLGDKAVDYFQKVPGITTALRTQGALRFAWNPFFRAKVSTKIEVLAQAEANGKFPTIAGTNKILKMIFPEQYAQIDGMRQTLRNVGALDEKPGFGVAGEATDATGMTTNLNHKLTVSQERSVSSLVLAQAKAAGVDGETFVKQFPQQVRDTVQMIAQYDRNANFINSPLARTLNFAFFPFRFETKVATIMAKSLARTDTMTQFAVIKGLYGAHDFLNSPAGQAWYSQNSDVIKLVEYLTPIQTLGEVATILGGKADSISSFGELGGLPFGFIPQLLDKEGLTHLTQSAYLDPKTGQELPNYVPATDKGRLLVAIQSLLGSMFSYPGSELGLPSKNQITQGLASGVTGGNKSTDLKQTAPLPLTPDQLQFQNTVQNANRKGAPASTQPSPQPISQPIPPATTSTTVAPTPVKARSKKKADFRPALMPGQSQLGVIPQ